MFLVLFLILLAGVGLLFRDRLTDLASGSGDNEQSGVALPPGVVPAEVPTPVAPSQTAPAPAIAAPARPRNARPPAVLLEVAARHKHRFGSGCSGTAIFEADAFTFRSEEHPVHVNRSEIAHIDGPGFDLEDGKDWHFAFVGRKDRDVQAVFTSWMAGSLKPVRSRPAPIKRAR